MKLQVALDRLSYEECFDIIPKILPYADIIEIGTGIIKEYGLGVVRNIKEKYPETKILADVKICDAGESESEKAFLYGADIITVMSFADSKTISSCLSVSEKYNGTLVVDLLNNHSVSSIENLKSLGVKNVSVHIGKDQQKDDDNDFETFANIINEYDFKTYFAGGINKDNLAGFLKYDPDVVIVGSGITSKDSPEKESEIIQRMISNEKI